MGGDIVRRGQLLSMDALVSIVLVIMILGTVSATSESLRSGITSMIGWYERSNIADNMLDVLTKSPGVPEDWDSTGHVIVIGLRDNNSEYLSSAKLFRLIQLVNSNNTTVISKLSELAGGKNFELRTYYSLYSVEANYSVTPVFGAGPSEAINACDPSDLPTDKPVVANCSNTFQFTGYQPNNPPPWWLNNYSNPYSVCVLSNTYVGNNFDLALGDYFGINGNLNVGSDGNVTSGSWFVNGDATVGNSGYGTVNGDVYVNGTLEVQSNGHLTASGGVYVSGDAKVHDGAYLNVGRDLYVMGNLDKDGNGNVYVKGSGYVFGNMNPTGSSTIISDNDLFIKGSVTMGYSSKIQVSRELYIGGPLTVKGTVTAGTLYLGDYMYIDDGSTVEVYGDAYIFGNVEVHGTLIVHGNLYIDGNLFIDYSDEVEVDNTLFISGDVTNHGTLNAGNVEHYIPSDVEMPQFNVNPPVILAPPCVSGEITGISINISNLSVSMELPGFGFPGFGFQSPWRFAVINGTPVWNEAVINASKSSASWVEYSERRLPMVALIYSREYNITMRDQLPVEIYSGILYSTPSGYLNITLPRDTDGSFVIVGFYTMGSSEGYMGLAVQKVGAKILAATTLTVKTSQGSQPLNEEECNIRQAQNSILVPVSCILPPATVTNSVSFTLWMYDSSFPWVEIEDLGNLKALMMPSHRVCLIRLWVWGG